MVSVSMSRSTMLNTLVVIEIPLTFSGDLGYLCDIYTHCESGNMYGVVHVAAAAPESPSAYTTEWRMDGMTGDDLASDLGLSTITPTGMVDGADYWMSEHRNRRPAESC